MRNRLILIARYESQKYNYWYENNRLCFISVLRGNPVLRFSDVLAVILGLKGAPNEKK